MVSAFAHILFVLVLGATLVSTPPIGTLQLKLHDFECKIFDKLDVEEYYITTTQIRFRTLDRGIIAYPKTQIKEIHGTIVGKEGEFLERNPVYEIESIQNSECIYDIASTKNIQ